MSANPRRAVKATASFLRWWITELESALQDLLAFVAPAWRRPLTLRIDAHRVVLSDSASPAGTSIWEFERASPGALLPESLPESAIVPLGSGRRIRVLLDAHYAFVNRLCLPLAAMPYLRSAIVLQIPKLMPLEASRLLTDFEITRADTKRSLIEVAVAAVKRSDVEPLLELVRRWGFRVASVHLQPGPDLTARFRFEHADHFGRRSIVSRADRVLMGTAAVLGLTCITVAVTESYRADQALERAQRITQVPASASLAKRQHLIEGLEPFNALSDLENSVGVGKLLAEFSTRIPHDAFLTTWEVKGRQLRIVGLSSDVVGLVKSLGASALLTDIELRTSMSAGIGTGKDRFEIIATTQESRP